MFKKRMLANIGLILASVFILAAAVMALGLSPYAIAVPAVFAAGLIAFAPRLTRLGIVGGVKVRSAMSENRVVTNAKSGAAVKDTVYLINGIPMLCLESADTDVATTYLMIGLIEYAKLSAQAWTGGQKVYWDNGNSRFTTASAGNTLAGVAAEAVANPTSTGFVYLNPFLVGTNQLENTIADPGTGVAIPVVASGVCPITIGSAGAETNTLAAPAYIGLTLVLTADVVGTGTRVITCATLVNQTGNNTLTFAQAADTIVLVSTQIAGALRWRVLANDGVALSTV